MITLLDRVEPTLSLPGRDRVARTKHLVVHSYGGGVQSRALFYLAVNGKIERPDVVIFADTQQEPDEVYRAVAVDKVVADSNGIDFRCITYGDLAQPRSGLLTPLFTTNLATGKKGQLIRTCTERYKIQPIRREVRSMGAKSAVMWIGISTDEVQRMKPSLVKWVEHRWPLIDLGYSRADCLAYLDSLGIKATRSACTFCPYKGRTEWERLAPRRSR